MLRTIKNQHQAISETGFTVIELMIVIALVAILASIALPSYKEYIANAKGQELAIALTASINRAKSEATAQSSNVAVCSLASPIPINQTCGTFACLCGNASNWQNGWMVYNLSNNTVIAVYNHPTAANNIQVATGAYVFNSTGLSQTPTTVFTIKPTGCGHGSTVTVTYPYGRPQSCPGRPGCVPPTCP